jgi:hypothetical protein
VHISVIISFQRMARPYSYVIFRHFATFSEHFFKNLIFWDITLCRQLKVSRRFGETCLHLQGRIMSQAETSFPPAFTLVYCLAHSLTLNMEVTYSSETAVDFQRTTERYFSKMELFISTVVRTSDISYVTSADDKSFQVQNLQRIVVVR